MMNEQLMVLLFILGIIAFILVTDRINQSKLKAQIKKDWGNLPRHLPKDNEESLLKAYESRTKQAEVMIDDLTWDDLNMFEVFKRINLTYSSIGSEKLYQTLREYNLYSENTEKLEIPIHYLENNPNEREDISFRFARLGKRDYNYAQIYLNGQTINPLGSHSLYVFLGLLPLIGFLSSFFIGAIGFVVAVLALCVNTILYLIKKGQRETELAAMNYLVQSLSLSHTLSKKETPIKNELQKNWQPFKSALRFGFAFRVKSGSESEMFIEMLSAAFLVPFISFGVLSKKINHYNTEAKILWELMGQLEVAIAILNLRLIYQDYSCQPEFSDEKSVIAEDVIHPLYSPVPNPVNWSKNTLITGSNASGKSTYVRSVAINIIFAQTLNTCLATSFTLKRGGVISSMGVQDSIIDGDSYFVAELKSLQRLIEQVQQNMFYYSFIDEILKGTNTIERIAASSSIIQWLTTQNQLAFIATHDIELPQILQNQCDNIHFEESVSKEDGITFDYLLKTGIATSRNAINLIESMNFPTSVINSAHQKAKFFDENRSWSD
jgi:hypothetical protein